MNYSQSGEDKFLNEHIFKNKRGGFFLELGACDGVLYSNTKFYEETLGWSGILIEPQPQFFNAIAKNRPNSKAYNCAIIDSDRPLEMKVRAWLHEGDPVGTLTDASFDSHLEHWHSEQSAGILINTRRLDDILHECNVNEIHLFSLDVEGSEYEVLQTMDWSIPVGVFIIEMLQENEAKNVLCRDLLKQHNFTYYCEMGGNEIWLGEKYREMIGDVEK